MQRIYVAAAVYTVLGLVSGVFYREFTKYNDFVGDTQLSTLHTHFLVLGMTFFLLVLALNATFGLERDRLFMPFFVTYNVGLVWMTTMMVVKGIWQVVNTGEYPAALAGISGLGHITMAVALFLFFRLLYRGVKMYTRNEARG